MNDEEALDAQIVEAYKGAKDKVDKWKKKANPHLKDERGLRHLDVRIVGMLSACTVKLGKPRPDGTPGQKWAILQVDDGTGVIDAFCFGKAWEQFNVNGCLEQSVDQLVMLCGEVSRRVNYEKDDKMEKKNPSVGDYNFTVKEAYPLGNALAQLSKGLRISMHYSDPDLKDKVCRIRDAVHANPGALPVLLELRYDDGRMVEIDLGPTCRVGCTVAFLSSLGKIVQHADYSFRPDDRVYFAPREPRPWEM